MFAGDVGLCEANALPLSYAADATAGLEPATLGPKNNVLLCISFSTLTNTESHRRGSNPRYSGQEPDALPLGHGGSVGARGRLYRTVHISVQFSILGVKRVLWR